MSSSNFIKISNSMAQMLTQKGWTIHQFPDKKGYYIEKNPSFFKKG